jgi:hypothetical protein
MSSIKSCFKLSHPEPIPNSAWVNIVSFEHCGLGSLVITNTMEQYQNVTDDCHTSMHTSSTAPKLTLNFVSRANLAISVEAAAVECNISCNFNVWRPRHDNCSNYTELAALTQRTLPVCHNKNGNVSIISTDSVISGVIYFNNEPQIINQCRGKS